MPAIRFATPADIPGMHRVRLAVRENRLESIVLGEEDYVREITPPGAGWVIEDAGGIVGFAIGNGRTGHVWALFVHPDHEGSGYGRALQTAMVSWMCAGGLLRLTLTTAPGTRAERFYRASGWSSVGASDGGEIRFELRCPRPSCQS